MLVTNPLQLAQRIEQDIIKGMSVKDAFEQTYSWGIDSGTAYYITSYLVNSSVRRKFLPFAKKELSIFDDLWRTSK